MKRPEYYIFIIVPVTTTVYVNSSSHLSVTTQPTHVAEWTTKDMSEIVGISDMLLC
jgi:hypothetical protein